MDRMFQDVAGTIPAVKGGDPVGRVDPAAGEVKALQPVTLSRPTLGRFPKGTKVRNLLKESENFDSTTQWLPSAINNGGTITATKGGVVTDGGKRGIRYSFSGVATAHATIALTAFFTIPLDKEKTPITISFAGRLLGAPADFTTTNDGIRFDIQQMSAANANLGSITGSVARPLNDYSKVTHTVSTFAEGTVAIRFRLAMRVASGRTLDAMTMDLANVQAEYGTVVTPYQPIDVDGFPLLGYGAVRNLANGAQAVGDNSYWRQLPFTSSGVYQGVINYGVEEDGLPFVDILYEGTPTVSSLASTYVHNASLISAKEGELFTSSMYVKIIGGSGVNVTGVRCEVTTTRDGSYVRTVPSTNVKPTDYQFVTTTGGIIASDTALGANQVRTALALSVAVGQPINITVRIKGLQFERGSAATTVQFNYGPNNVTESGVPDVWYLYNDGGDSLPTETVPDGIYTVASIDAYDRTMFEELTLNSPGVIDTLRQNYQSDVIVKQGVMTDEDKEALIKYWNRS